MSVHDMAVPSALPPCDTRCTESMLGLLNIEPARDIWELLRVSYRNLKHALVCVKLGKFGNNCLTIFCFPSHNTRFKIMKFVLSTDP